MVPVAIGGLYDEIIRLLGKMNYIDKVPVLKGATSFMTDADKPVDSPAARDIIARAHAHSPEDPLYVVGIAVATDIAAAIALDPTIIDKIVVVWLGGNPTYWPNTMEFNLSQDLNSARVLFNSGVALVQIHAMTVSSHLLATPAELKEHLGGKNALCDTLVELFAAYSNDHFGWSKEIWDICAIAYLINPDWVPCQIVHSPLLTDYHTFSEDDCRHLIKRAFFIYRNPVFRDMFVKLTSLKD